MVEFSTWKPEVGYFLCFCCSLRLFAASAPHRYIELLLPGITRSFVANRTAEDDKVGVVNVAFQFEPSTELCKSLQHVNMLKRWKPTKELKRESLTKHGGGSVIVWAWILWQKCWMLCSNWSNYESPVRFDAPCGKYLMDISE